MEDFSDIKCCLKCLCVYALENQFPGLITIIKEVLLLFCQHISRNYWKVEIKIFHVI